MKISINKGKLINMIKIAVGIGENKNIIKACKHYKHDNICIEYIYNDEDLVNAILDKNINAVIRGSLPASDVMKQLKTKFPKITRATYVNGNGIEFLLTPVGIDEGQNIKSKYETIINCCEFLKKQGTTPKIAIMASGRKGDYGRNSEISQSIDESEKLTSLIKETTNYKIKNYYILIEQAIKDKYNIIIAPNGIIGNIIFRTLVLINKWSSYGAITFGLEQIYIDTSRDQSIEGYERSLKLAYKLVNI